MNNKSVMIASVAAVVFIFVVFNWMMGRMEPATPPPMDGRTHTERGAPPTNSAQAPSVPNAKPETPGGTVGPATTGSPSTSDAAGSSTR